MRSGIRRRSFTGWMRPAFAAPLRAECSGMRDILPNFQRLLMKSSLTCLLKMYIMFEEYVFSPEEEVPGEILITPFDRFPFTPLIQ